MSTYFRYFTATFFTGSFDGTVVRGLLFFFLHCRAKTKKTWHECVDNILFTQCFHFIFTDVMQFIYFMQMFFLTFFISLQQTLGGNPIFLGFSFDNNYFYFSKLIVKDKVSLLETLCNLMYAKLGGATTETLLYNRGLSVTLQETTNEHFTSLSDICCFPLVERLYYCMNYCQTSFDIVVKRLTLPSSDFFSVFFFVFKNYL